MCGRGACPHASGSYHVRLQIDILPLVAMPVLFRLSTGTAGAHTFYRLIAREPGQPALDGNPSSGNPAARLA